MKFVMTGWKYKSVSVIKCEAGNYYAMTGHAVYKLEIEKGTLDDVEYDNENPITNFELEGTIDLL